MFFYVCIIRGAVKLGVLSERALGKAVGEYVTKDDGDAISNMVDYQVKDTNKNLNNVGQYQTFL